jgi:hypothetical protein
MHELLYTPIDEGRNLGRFLADEINTRIFKPLLPPDIGKKIEPRKLVNTEDD